MEKRVTRGKEGGKTRGKGLKSAISLLHQVTAAVLKVGGRTWERTHPNNLFDRFVGDFSGKKMSGKTFKKKGDLNKSTSAWL